MASGIKEKEIENAILMWLNYQPGIFAFKVNTTGFFDTKLKMFRKNRSPFIIRGTPDIIGIARSKFLAIEVKTPTTMKRFLRYPNERDLNQKNFIEKVNQMGGISACVCSLDEVIQLVQSAGEIAKKKNP